MTTVSFHKVVSSLPALTNTVPDGIYLLRVGDGFDLYVANSGATAIHKVNPDNLSEAAVQTSDFTAALGNSYPVDLSGEAATSNIDITAPTGTVGKSFSVRDQTRSMTDTRTATLLGRIEGDAAAQFVLNAAGAEVVLTWRDAVYGYAVKARDYG